MSRHLREVLIVLGCFVLLLMLLLISAEVAGAQTPSGGQCAPREKVVAVLTEKYGETRRSFGIAANNTVMELYASDSTASWTITVTMPSGVTCMVASGQGFYAMHEALPPAGDEL